MVKKRFDSPDIVKIAEKEIIASSMKDLKGPASNDLVPVVLSSVEVIPSGYKYYLCGNGMMVVEVRDLLIERGIPFTNIISEIYC